MSKVRMKLQHAGNPTVYEIDILLHPEWAPLGAQRFLDLVDAKYFDGCPLYRFIPNFIVQWGVPLDPALWKQWGEKKIKDDPVTQSNKLARLSFATSGPNARGSQIFVNLKNNSDLDDQGFAPFAELVEPDAALAALNGCVEVKGVDQTEAKATGKPYFDKFPKLSKWVSAERL